MEKKYILTMIIGILDLVGGTFVMLAGIILSSKGKLYGYIMLYGGISIIIVSLIIIFFSYFNNKKKYKKLQSI